MKLDLSQPGFVIYDGSTGSLLQKYGLKPGQLQVAMSITAPETVEEIQRKYLQAGSRIITTNSFGADAKKLAGTGYSVEEIVSSAVAITKRVCADEAVASLDIGPTGRLMEPMGEMTFDEAYELFQQQVACGEAAGADAVTIETMTDIFEAKAALLAVRENTELPILISMTFDESGHSLTGCIPESFAIMAERLGAAAVGINCSLEPAKIYPSAQKMVAVTSLPLIIKPNAGLPHGEDSVYDVSADEFVRQMLPFARLGVKIIGGCCGTTPEYISKLKAAFDGTPRTPPSKPCTDYICSPYVFLPAQHALHCVAESCTSIEDTIEYAERQAERGSEVVSVCLPERIEPKAAFDAVREIQESVRAPLCIISENAPALDFALRAVSGIAAVRGNQFTDICAKYGAVMI